MSNLLAPTRSRPETIVGTDQRDEPRSGYPDATVASSTAIERVRPLLEAAAELDLRDVAGWGQLRKVAASRLNVLIAGGELPDHLAIVPHDPPVVVTRSIVAAWRHVTDAPSRALAPGCDPRHTPDPGTPPNIDRRP
jgi:hypothetical protein